MSEVRDFLYLDLERITSLYSQLTGGLVQQFETSKESQKDSRNIRNYDFKLFKHEAGGTGLNSESLKEVWVSHHDLYSRLENELFNNGFAADLVEDITSEDIETGKATEIFQSTLCVRAEGWAVLEDYERIKRISGRYNEITEIINRSIQETLKSSPEYKEILEKFEEKQKETTNIKDRNLKARKNEELKSFQKLLNQLIDTKKIGIVDDWVIDGMRKWIDTFLPGIFNLRLYPFQTLPSFHILSHLKRECFLDKDIESIHFLYGSKPTLKIGMLGIITSVPPKEKSEFDPMVEFEGLESKEGLESQSFERAFRGVFRGFDGFEEIIRTCRYPRIMVYPISIYRAIKPNKSLQRTRA